MTLGSVRKQLVLLVDAARAEGSAKVIASCGDSAIELTFGEDGIYAEAGRDASKTGSDRWALDDEIVLQILGWRRHDDRQSFVRRWVAATPSEVVADDVLRTAVNGYQCESVELKLLLTEPAELSSVSA
ncbi:MAG: hypothetical protein QOK28_1704 [Actinomycetota bacterium]